MRLKGPLAFALLAALAACGRGDDEQAGGNAGRVIPEAEENAVNVANGTAPLPAATPSPAPLDMFGDVRIGMTLADMRAAGLTVSHDPGPDPTSPCSYARVKGWSKIFLMMDGDQLARIDVAAPDHPTIGGVEVGQSEAEALKSLGGSAVVQPHPYTGPEGHYLIVHRKGAPLGLILETDGKKVVSYRFGRWPQVQLIEGCS